MLKAGNAIHVVVKHVAQLGTEKYMRQAERDADEDEFPIVVKKQDPGEWCVMFRLSDSVKFSDMIVENRKEILE